MIDPSVPRILLVLQQETSVPGRVGEKLKAMGYDLDIRRPNLGDPLPAPDDGHAGAVIYGGPMSANDTQIDGIRAQLAWLNRALGTDLPILGLCLGAQLISRACGGAVTAHEQGLAEIGYYEIVPTAAARDFLKAPMTVYQWHREGFELPTGAMLLATGMRFPNQAYRLGRAVVGLQFHPEVTAKMMAYWLKAGARMLELPGAQPAAAHLAGRAAHDAHLAAWLDRFLNGWVGPAQGAVKDAS